VNGRTAKQQQRFDEIVAAAARVFRREGYDAATLEDVAGALGVRKASLYRYIGSKEDLLYAIVDGALQRMIAANVRWRDGSDDVLEQIQMFLEDHITFVIDNHDPVGVYFADLRALPRARQRALQILADEYRGTLETLVREAIAGRRVDAASNPVLATHGLFGIVNYAHRWYRPGRGVSRTKVVHELPVMAVSSLGSTTKRRGK
jgi:AcrR family transcriptional regulator